MEKLKITTDFFIAALEDRDNSHYVDSKTGEIIFYQDDNFADNEVSRDELDDNPERYIYIESMESYESFNMMEDFTNNLTNEKAKKELLIALSMRKPFRKFKDTLYNFSDIQDAWYAYQESEMKKYAQEWLTLHKIDAELI